MPTLTLRAEPPFVFLRRSQGEKEALFQSRQAFETECYEVMNPLGYKIVEDEDELRTVSFPLTD